MDASSSSSSPKQLPQEAFQQNSWCPAGADAELDSHGACGSSWVADAASVQGGGIAHSTSSFNTTRGASSLVLECPDWLDHPFVDPMGLSFWVRCVGHGPSAVSSSIECSIAEALCSCRSTAAAACKQQGLRIEDAPVQHACMCAWCTTRGHMCMLHALPGRCKLVILVLLLAPIWVYLVVARCEWNQTPFRQTFSLRQHDVCAYAAHACVPAAPHHCAPRPHIGFFSVQRTFTRSKCMQHDPCTADAQHGKPSGRGV